MADSTQAPPPRRRPLPMPALRRSPDRPSLPDLRLAARASARHAGPDRRRVRDHLRRRAAAPAHAKGKEKSVKRLRRLFRVISPRGYRLGMWSVFTVAALVTSIASLSASASASTPDPAVWVGSPVNGTWPNTAGCAGATYPSDSCSLPTVHHIVYYSTF